MDSKENSGTKGGNKETSPEKKSVKAYIEPVEFYWEAYDTFIIEKQLLIVSMKANFPFLINLN